MTDAILAAFAGILSDDIAQEVIDYRKRMGRKFALTERAAKMLAKRLARCPDPNAAAEEMIVRGWQSIEPEWLPKAKPKSIGDIFRQDAIRMGILPNEQPDAKTERMGASHGSRQDGSLGLFGGPAIEAVSFRRH